MTLLQTSLRGGALIAALVLFRAVFFRRIPKRLLPRLWLGAAAVLLCPVPLKSRLSVYGLLSGVENGASKVASGAVPPLLWAGCGLCAALLLTLYLLGLRRFRLAETVRDGRISRWLAAHPLRRPLRVKQAERLRRPVSGGVLRPVILLPVGCERLSDPALNCVLTHEWVHVKGLHALCKLVLGAVLCLHWFNPLVWLLVWLAGRDLEYAADEAVLAAGVPRAVYARLLLNAAAGGTLPFQSAFGGSERRIRTLLRRREPGRASRVFFALAGAALLLCFATVPAAEPAEAEPAAAPLTLRERTAQPLPELPQESVPLSPAEGTAQAVAAEPQPILDVRQDGNTFHIHSGESAVSEEEALALSFRLVAENCPQGARYVVLLGDAPARLPPVVEREQGLLLAGLACEGSVVCEARTGKGNWVFLGVAAAEP